MRHVIVTGGSGLAGHAVCRELASHGYEVTNLDRFGRWDPEATP